MAFVQSKFLLASAGSYDTASTQIWVYESSTDSLATIRASAYFNSATPAPNVGDQIMVDGSDGSDIYRVTAITPNVTVVDWVTTTATEIPITQNEVLIGNGSGVGVSGLLDGASFSNLSSGALTPSGLLVFEVDTPGGVTADTTVTMNYKVKVLDVLVIAKAGGAAGDLVQVANNVIGTPITEAIDIQTAVNNKIFRNATLQHANIVINANDDLLIKETDGGAGAPALKLIITCARSA